MSLVRTALLTGNGKARRERQKRKLGRTTIVDLGGLSRKGNGVHVGATRRTIRSDLGKGEGKTPTGVGQRKNR